MILAHQGGWDEFLLVATPIAAFAGLLWLANRRAQAHAEGRLARPPGAAPPPGTSAATGTADGSPDPAPPPDPEVR